MQIKQVIKPLLIIVVAFALAVVMVYSKPQAKQKILEPQPLLVDVLQVEPSALQVSLQSYGQVLPRTQSTLTSEVSGIVVSVSADFVVGGFFKRGDILLEIDNRRYMVALKRSEAEVARAKSLLAQERGQAHVAKQQWQQRVNKEVDATARDLALRLPQLQEAMANLESAEANLQQAKDDLENTVIRAPYDGLLRQKLADIGGFVNQGTALAQLYAVDYAEVRLPIPEYQLSYLSLSSDLGRMNDTSAVFLTNREAAEQLPWPATLVRTEGVLDSRSRVLHVVARVEDPYGLSSGSDTARPILRMGSFVEAEIVGKNIDNLIAIPAYVLRPGNLLWVVDKDNRLRERRVDVLRLSDEQRYVYSGLQAGERICLTALSSSVLPGTQVVVNLSQISDVAVDAPEVLQQETGDE